MIRSQAPAFALNVLLAAAFVAFAATGSAQEEVPRQPSSASDVSRPSFRLDYLRDPEADGCPSGSTLLEHEVRSRTGYDPFDHDASRRVSVRLELRGESLHALVELSNGEAGANLRQDLVDSDGSCRSLLERVALAIALAVAPPRAGPTADPAPKSDNPVGIQSTPSPVVGPPAVSRLTYGFAAGGRVDAFRAPILTGGPLLAAEARWNDFSVGLEGHFLLPAQGPTQGGGAVRASAIEAQVDLCLRQRIIGICALAASGVESISGREFRDPSSGSVGFLSLGARLLTEVSLPSSLELWFFGDVLLPIVRPSAVIGSDGTGGTIETQVWRSPDVALTLGAALGFEIH